MLFSFKTSNNLHERKTNSMFICLQLNQHVLFRLVDSNICCDIFLRRKKILAAKVTYFDEKKFKKTKSHLHKKETGGMGSEFQQNGRNFPIYGCHSEGGRHPTWWNRTEWWLLDGNDVSINLWEMVLPWHTISDVPWRRRRPYCLQ